jgi:hypothetical protein
MTRGWVNPFEYEISREIAGTLGRIGKRLERALRELKSREGWNDVKRDELIWEATELVTSIVVQREACGLRDSSFVFEFYSVPREVIARIGVKRPGPVRGRNREPSRLQVRPDVRQACRPSSRTART